MEKTTIIRKLREIIKYDEGYINQHKGTQEEIQNLIDDIRKTIIKDKTKFEISKKDIAIIVTENGQAEAYIPDEGEVTWQSLHGMLKEIRRLEKVFTELVNKTYVKK
ncbi:MAG: hypothetical protein ACFFD1_04555 [Candidatus Thorarchaeota archaeon]